MNDKFQGTFQTWEVGRICDQVLTIGWADPAPTLREVSANWDLDNIALLAKEVLSVARIRLLTAKLEREYAEFATPFPGVTGTSSDRRPEGDLLRWSISYLKECRGSELTREDHQLQEAV